MIALPLQGKALREGNSAFVDSNWNAYPNQWEVLWSKPRLSEEFLKAKIKEWLVPEFPDIMETDPQNREKPWKGQFLFRREDVEGKLSITLSNGIYVDSISLKPAMQNKIRRMAAIQNPVFYKNQAIGMANFSTSQWIYLGKDDLNGYIQIPRGLYEGLLERVKVAGIPYEVSDERQQGRPIEVSDRKSVV